MGKKHPNRSALLLLLGSNVVAEFAHGILMLAIPWHFADALGRPELFGWLFAGVTFLTLFWSLYGGTLIDRYSRKKVLLWMNLIGGMAILGLAFSGSGSDTVSLFGVSIAFTITVFNFNIHYPTLYAFAQEISPPEEYARTNALIEVQGQSTRMIASAVAALLLAGTDASSPILHEWSPIAFEAWELDAIFLLDAAAYGLTILCLLPIRYRPVENRIIDRGKVKERLRTGFHFLRKNPLLFHFGNASYVIFIFVLIQAYFLMPVYIKDHLRMDADVYGIGEALFAFGAIGAGFSVRKLMRRVHSVPAINGAMLVSGLAFLVCVWTRSFWIFMGFNLILGMANSATRVMRITYLFEHVPNRVIGRTNSVFQAMNILLRTFFTGLFALPFFSGKEGVVNAYFISGAAILIGMIPLLLYQKALKFLKVEMPEEAKEDKEALIP